MDDLSAPWWDDEEECPNCGLGINTQCKCDEEEEDD